MKFSAKIIIVTSLCLLIGCVENLTADDAAAYRYLARGDTAQNDDKLIRIISNQSSFDQVFYQLLNRSSTPETINFAEYQVLLVMAGAQQNTLKLEIERFSGQSDQVQIILNSEYAGANCPAPAVVRQPWMLVVFPRVTQPLAIQEQIKVTTC
ncbi:hypothetical protein [Rheinheimera metallidurans]|uniref:hypothetical protein n=1 Tax=Rheinheimera metallidurans TaxID=2925781 RepID=UPI003002B11F